jgi:hypothetical protein
MSDGDNTKMYIGLAVLVVAIGYYYMFMMTPAPPVGESPPATGTGAGTLTGAVANPATGVVVPVKCQIGFEMKNGVCTAINRIPGEFTWYESELLEAQPDPLSKIVMADRAACELRCKNDSACTAYGWQDDVKECHMWKGNDGGPVFRPSKPWYPKGWGVGLLNK